MRVGAAADVVRRTSSASSTGWRTPGARSCAPWPSWPSATSRGARRPAGSRFGAADLAAALASVRFAVAPGEPVAGAPDGVDLRVLTGILVEVCGAEVRCVATDRYRLAVGWAPVVGHPRRRRTAR